MNSLVKKRVVKADTWHFRLYSFLLRLFNEDVPKRVSLCKYFWTTVGLGLAVAFLSLAVLFVAFTTIPAIPVLLLAIFDVIEVPEESVVSAWVIFGVLEILIAIFFGIWYSIKKFVRYRKHKKWLNTLDDNQEKEDSLFVAYVKAKKSKLCPILEIEDKEEK